MRRKEREMNEAFALSVADKCEWGTVAMTDLEGNPYALPISIVRIENSIYFHSARSGQKTDCLRKNNRVCIACVGDTRLPPNIFTTEYECAIVRGNAVEVQEDEEKIRALKALCKKYTPLNMHEFESEISRSLKATAIWRVDIDGISGKRKKYASDGHELKFGKTE